MKSAPTILQCVVALASRISIPIPMHIAHLGLRDSCPAILSDLPGGVRRVLLPHLQRSLIALQYDQLDRFLLPADITLLNLGFSELSGEKPEAELQLNDEANRPWVSLYHRLCSSFDLSGLDVLDVGCGRGGGADYVLRYLSPRSVEGVDISRKSIAFAERRFGSKRLSFRVADAEDLPQDAESFDAVLNVESAHYYPSFASFLSEAFRVLRPGGVLLLADFCGRTLWPRLRTSLQSSSFQYLSHSDITPQIVESLTQTSAYKSDLIDRYSPRLWRARLPAFAGVVGSSFFESFANGEARYHTLALRKPGQFRVSCDLASTGGTLPW